MSNRAALRARTRRAPVVAAALAAALSAIGLAAHLSAAQLPPAQEEALREAARQGDLARVTALVETGVAVDAPTRYGATPLFYAAERGHLDIVRFLIARGASVHIEDSFYGNSPLSRALAGGHFDVARYLIERGAEGAGRALLLAVRAGDRPLFEAAIASGDIQAEPLEAARAAALDRQDEEMTRRLAAVTPAPGRLRAVDPQALRSYAGAYYSDALQQSVDIRLEGEALSVRVDGGPWHALAPAPGSGFESRDDSDLRVSFGGRGGMVERLALTRDGQTDNFRPLDEAEGRDPAPAGQADQVSGTRVPTAPRLAPRPWPAFRGANGAGRADGQGAPVSWDVKTGDNVRWKTPIPGFANAAPIVWGDQVFITTAVSSSGNDGIKTGLYGDTTPVDDMSPHVWRLYSLDRRTGAIQWERVVHKGAPKTKRHTKASQANSTPVTDGRHLVAVFGSLGLLVTYDLDGRLLWKKDLGVMESGWFYDPEYQWGHSSSPIIYRDTVILQVDMPKHSYLAAFDVATGDEVWRTMREDEVSTFATPAIYSGPDGDELVTNGTTIRGYDPATGTLLWFLGPNSEIAVPTPVMTEDLIVVMAGYPPVRPIYAVRPGQRGDLTLPEGRESSAALAWSKSRGGTYIPTPIVYDGYLYATAENGRLTAYDVRSGEVVYQVRIGGVGGSYSASPIAADGKLYFASEEGDVYVVRAGPTYELLAKNPMGEIIMANPAVSDGVMVIRTHGHVYGIGEPPATR
jgi:outer membrane protein assembly factor BamB